MGLGYTLAFFSYAAVGVLGYYGFSANIFTEGKLQITQNALNMFTSTHILAFLVRIACFFQMFSVFPLLFHIVRS
jgi:hypothetical protein